MVEGSKVSLGEKGNQNTQPLNILMILINKVYPNFCCLIPGLYSTLPPITLSHPHELDQLAAGLPQQDLTQGLAEALELLVDVQAPHHCGMHHAPQPPARIGRGLGGREK